MRCFVFFIKHYSKDFLQAACFTRAGSLAFTTVMALVPLMVVALYVLSLLPISQAILLESQRLIFSNFVAGTGQTVLSYLQIFVERVHTLSLLSSLFLLVTAVSIMFSLESSLNVIWQIEERRGWLKALSLYVLILIIAPVLTMASLTVSFFVAGLLKNYMDVPLGWAPIMMPSLLSLAAYWFIYKVLPNGYVNSRCALIGAVAATLLFEMAKNAFVWYIKMFPNYQIIYGALATFPILLIWIYLCWLIFLCGAVLSSMLQKKLRYAKPAGIKPYLG